MPKLTFQDQTIFITGANRGLGYALVRRFAAEGGNLVVHTRSESNAFTEDMRILAEKYGVQINCISFDLSNGDDMQSAIKGVLSAGLRVDVLVNNAGVAHGGLFQMTSLGKVREIFEVNFFAQLRVTQLILRHMVHQKSGSIVNIGSIAGLDLAAGNAAYGVSKAALMAFTMTLAAEVGEFGIRVNAVAPGLIDGEMGKLMESRASDRMIESSAMKRFADVHEVSEVVLFLASHAAAFVNGQTIRVDGGKS